jgi:hypothetical protein
VPHEIITPINTTEPPATQASFFLWIEGSLFQSAARHMEKEGLFILGVFGDLFKQALLRALFYPTRQLIALIFTSHILSLTDHFLPLSGFLYFSKNFPQPFPAKVPGPTTRIAYQQF